MIRYGRPDSHILLVDDDASFLDALDDVLSREGFRTTAAKDGPSAIDMFKEDLPDLVIVDLLDVVPPGMSGFQVCRELRRGSQVPIAILTGRNAESDRVAGLDAGADDFITKQCGERELIARLRAALRRGPKRLPVHPGMLGDKCVELDPAGHDVWVNGEIVDLSLKEFELLRVLLVNKGKVVPRRKLVAAIWDGSYSNGSKSLETQVRRLRARLETDPASPRRIVSVRGVGYKFEPELDHSALLSAAGSAGE